MSTQVTAIFDDEIAAKSERLTKESGRPADEIVREAIRDYQPRPTTKSDKVGEEERLRRLGVIDEIMKQPPTRPQSEVDEELRQIRESRRTGWSRPSDK